MVYKECAIEVAIIDVHSWVKLSQKFYNPDSTSSNRFVYNFSMLAGAAIHGFEMISEDGTLITGQIKEKDEARQQMEAAIKAGNTASLGEEVTKDGKLSTNLETIPARIMC